MVVRRIIISAALLCILPLPFSSSPITDSAPTTLVLGAPPVHLLTSHAPSSASSSSSSSSSSSASSLDHAKFASSDNKRDLHHHSPANSASTTAARRSLKKRVTANNNNHIKSIYNPPPPPKNMAEFKKCFHECITQTQEMYPECKGSVSSNPATDREGSEYMTWQNLCPLASLVCLHYCKLQDCDWSQWIDAVDQGLMQSGVVAVEAKSSLHR